MYAKTILSTVVILVRKHQHVIDLNAIKGSKLINKQINIQRNRSNKIRKQACLFRSNFFLFTAFICKFLKPNLCFSG